MVKILIFGLVGAIVAFVAFHRVLFLYAKYGLKLPLNWGMYLSAMHNRVSSVFVGIFDLLIRLFGVGYLLYFVYQYFFK